MPRVVLVVVISVKISLQRRVAATRLAFNRRILERAVRRHVMGKNLGRRKRRRGSCIERVSAKGKTKLLVKSKAIEFKVDALVVASKHSGHVTGKQKSILRAATMALPPPVKPLTPSPMRSIHREFTVSPSGFAAMIRKSRAARFVGERALVRGYYV